MIMGVLPSGGCSVKPEIPDPADPGNRLVIEWTADL
jgi:hypothetical protein